MGTRLRIAEVLDGKTRDRARGARDCSMLESTRIERREPWQ